MRDAEEGEGGVFRLKEVIGGRKEDLGILVLVVVFIYCYQQLHFIDFWKGWKVGLVKRGV